MFYGLEEIDGSEYILQKSGSGNGLQVLPRDQVSMQESPAHVEGKPKGAKRSRSFKKSVEIESSIENVPDSALIHSDSSQHDDLHSKKSKIKTLSTKMVVNETKSTSKAQDSLIKDMTDAAWDADGTILIHPLLVDSLRAMNFHIPTPIQRAALPITLSNQSLCDVVGAAETGSGKTLVCLR
jgi:superfamily II DNA/RNA helicase